jgi:hypothetical protein
MRFAAHHYDPACPGTTVRDDPACPAAAAPPINRSPVIPKRYSEREISSFMTSFVPP